MKTIITLKREEGNKDFLESIDSDKLVDDIDMVYINYECLEITLKGSFYVSSTSNLLVIETEEHCLLIIPHNIIKHSVIKEGE